MGRALLFCLVLIASSGVRSATYADTGWLGGESHFDGYAPTDSMAEFGVWVDVPENVPMPSDRPPVVTALVVDTSGSMRGESLNRAKTAAAALLSNLRPGDRVALVGFSTEVQTLLPMTEIPSTGVGRRELLRQVQRMQARGDTNLYGGVWQGIHLVRDALRSGYAGRVLIFSDGVATVGPRDADAFSDMARFAANFGIQLAAVGIGLDYDERLLRTLAIRSAGRAYHLEEAANLLDIVAREVGPLAATLGFRAVLRIEGQNGASVTSSSRHARATATGVEFSLGNLYPGFSREVLIGLRVSNGALPRGKVGQATLRYDSRDGERVVRNIDLMITERRDGQSVRVAPRVQAMRDAFAAAEEQRRAAEAFALGHIAEAESALREASRYLRSAAEATPSARVRARYEAVGSRNRALEQAAPAAAASGRSTANRSGELNSEDLALDLEGF